MQIENVLFLLAVGLVVSMLTTWIFILRPYKSTRDLVDTVTTLSAEVERATKRSLEATERLNEMEVERAADRGMLRRVANEQADLKYDFSELRAGATRLIDQLVNEHDAIPVWQIPTKFDKWLAKSPSGIPLQPQPTTRAALQVMGELFDIGELRELVMELGIEWEDIPGETRRDKLRNLVERANRSGRLGELINTAKDKRPLANWLGL